MPPVLFDVSKEPSSAPISHKRPPWGQARVTSVLSVCMCVILRTSSKAALTETLEHVQSSLAMQFRLSSAGPHNEMHRAGAAQHNPCQIESSLTTHSKAEISSSCFGCYQVQGAHCGRSSGAQAGTHTSSTGCPVQSVAEAGARGAEARGG